MKRFYYILFLSVALLTPLPVCSADKSADNKPINIWADTDCKSKVWLTPYLAPGDNNPAIIVCPGGSYFWHDMEVEGERCG